MSVISTVSRSDLSHDRVRWGRRILPAVKHTIPWNHADVRPSRLCGGFPLSAAGSEYTSYFLSLRASNDCLQCFIWRLLIGVILLLRNTVLHPSFLTAGDANKHRCAADTGACMTAFSPLSMMYWRCINF